MSDSKRPANTHGAEVDNRRGFVRAIAGCATLLAARAAIAKPATGKVLTESDKIDVADRAEQMTQQAYALGHEYEGKYGGCAQCTVAALQDAVDFVPADENVFLASSCVDGGATPTGMANCGAFTGAGLVIGHLCGRSRENFSGKAGLSHKLIRQVHAKFAEAYGGVLCREVRAKSGAQCVDVVGKSAQWTAEILIEQFTNHSASTKAG